MQKKAHVSVKAHKGKKMSGGKKTMGKMSHMVIKPAKNGFMSEMHMMPKPMKDGDPYMPNEPEVNVHPSVDHLVDHVRGSMGAFGGEESPEEEKAEAEEAGGGQSPDNTSN